MSTGKRIGLVLSSVPPYSETFFKTQINGLAGNGFRIYLFAAGKQNPDLRCTLIKPYPVFNSYLTRMLSVCVVLPLTFIKVPARVIRLYKYEKESGTTATEIIKRLYLNAHILPYTLDWLHFGFATIALGREEVAQAIGAKMAVSFRGYDLNVYPLKNPGCYKKLWKKVDQVHSISLYLLERGFVLGLSRDKPWIVITPALSFGDDPEQKIRQELQSPLRILTVARLTWIKGLEYGIKAMAILRAMNIPSQYTIIGEGPDQEKLLFEIHDLDLADRVHLVGKLDHSATLAAMTQTDIYIQPSLNEGFCNSIMEAQANGCLCIASDVGGLPENILQNVTGWLVTSRSPEQIAEAVDRILRMTSVERKQVIQNAWRRMREDFGLTSHIEKWVIFYK